MSGEGTDSRPSLMVLHLKESPSPAQGSFLPAARTCECWAPGTPLPVTLGSCSPSPGPLLWPSTQMLLLEGRLVTHSGTQQPLPAHDVVSTRSPSPKVSSLLLPRAAADRLRGGPGHDPGHQLPLPPPHMRVVALDLRVKPGGRPLVIFSPRSCVRSPSKAPQRQPVPALLKPAVSPLQERSPAVPSR